MFPLDQKYIFLVRIKKWEDLTHSEKNDVGVPARYDIRKYATLLWNLQHVVDSKQGSDNLFIPCIVQFGE